MTDRLIELAFIAAVAFAAYKAMTQDEVPAARTDCARYSMEVSE